MHGPFSMRSSRMINRSISIILGITGLLLFTGSTPPPQCTVESAQILGHLYYLSNPMGNANDLTAFVNQYRAHLTSNGTVMKCAKTLGNKLIAQSLGAFSQADYDDAYGSVLEMGGTMDMAHDVAYDIQSGAVDLLMLGQELLWLVQVIPSAANGDWRLFNTTGTETRNMIREVMPIYQMMFAMDPSMAQIFDDVLAQFGPLVEYQMVMLADMMGLL